MPDLLWYVRRLSAMSAEEVLYRVRMELLRRRYRRLYNKGVFPPVDPPDLTRYRTNLSTPHLDHPLDGQQQFLQHADNLLEYKWDYFALDGTKEKPLNWHRDPSTGTISPRVYSLDLNYRSPKVVGNLKYVWEKNRHSHFSRLAAAFRISGDEKYAEHLAERFETWVDQNPFLEGINWTHPLEHGLRLLVWVWCERWLRGSTQHERLFGANSPLWESIERHMRFIEMTYSVGSSANNHLIGEMAGMFAASAAWPVFPRSESRIKLAGRLLEQELARQTFPDGLNREQAFFYHVNVAEYYLLCFDEAQRCGYTFGEETHAILRRMIEAIYALTDKEGIAPRYGDSDDATVLEIMPPGESRFSWLYLMANELLGTSFPVGQDSDIARFLLSYESKTVAREKNAYIRTRSFPDAGKYQLTTDRDLPSEIKVVAHAGPLGFGALAAHGHADALSFELSAGGKSMLVDPGTYTYHFDDDERNRFRGTIYHNTVVVDEIDQSRPAGPFLWASKAGCSVHDWIVDPDGSRLVASHDGYKSIGVGHLRSLQLHGTRLTIEDQVTGSDQHTVDIMFHFHPDCDVVLKDGNIFARRGGVEVQITPPTDWSADLFHGENELGWYSPVFGSKVPASTLRIRRTAELPVTSVSQIDVRIDVGQH
ncbi:heparinase II/III family protein [bacterium]|nr:heparinase II/III family protein [bacterium]